MLDNDLVLATLDTVHGALQAELVATRRLLQRTEDLLQVLEIEDAEAERFTRALDEQHAALQYAQSAEEATRQAKSRVQEIIPFRTWSFTEMQKALQGITTPSQYVAVDARMSQLKLLAADVFDVLQKLGALSVTVEEKLRRALGTVGEEARAVSQGRQAAQAYASYGTGAAARFIDKRE